jgi:hypothetical protein
MALTPAEKELLAVVQYYNEQRRTNKVRNLCGKLYSTTGGGLEISDIARLTGFSEEQAREFVNAFLGRGMTKKKLDTAEKKVAQKKRKVGAKRIAEKLTNENPVDLFDEPTGNRRLAIHLNANSDLPQRIAHDIAAAVNRELKPGDKFWGGKELRTRFECSEKSRSEAVKILVNHNWIELAEPGNFRKGYIVK